jgi:hypothetical protein
VAYQVSEVQVTHWKHVVGVGGHDVEDLTDFWRCRSCLSRLEHCERLSRSRSKAF